MRIKQLFFISFLISVSLLTNGCISVAVYSRLVIKPDMINHEYKHEGLLPSKEIIDGTYLGKVSISGKDYYHLQFFKVLRGDERCIHIYLECQDSNINSNNKELNGFLVEKEAENISSVKESLLFYRFNRINDVKTILSEVSQKAYSENEMREYPTYVSGFWRQRTFIWSQGTFICYPPYGWGNVDSWNCAVDISRVERSKVLPFIRPLYGVPAAIICIPADMALWLFGPLRLRIVENITGQQFDE